MPFWLVVRRGLRLLVGVDQSLNMVDIAMKSDQLAGLRAKRQPGIGILARIHFLSDDLEVRAADVRSPSAARCEMASVETEDVLMA